MIRRTLRWPRVCASPMEPAGAVCDFDRATGRMDVHSNSNMLNFAAWVLVGHAEDGARADRLPPDVHGRELRLQAPDGEGDRARRRDVASSPGGPVKFMEDRADNLLANDSQAPDRRYEAALALDADGRFLSLRTDVVDDYGAYFLFAVAGNTNAMAQTTGPYAIGSCETAVQGRADQQEPAGRVPRRGLGGRATGCSSGWSTRAAAGARDRRRSSCAGAT